MPPIGPRLKHIGLPRQSFHSKRYSEHKNRYKRRPTRKLRGYTPSPRPRSVSTEQSPIEYPTRSTDQTEISTSPAKSAGRESQREMAFPTDILRTEWGPAAGALR